MASTLPDFLAVEPLDGDPAAAGLVERAFSGNPAASSPDRLAVRLRAGSTPLKDLCFAIRQEGRLLASLQSWPVILVADGRRVPLVLIGPVAVDPMWQGRSLGRTLMDRTVETLEGSAILVGDASYYGRWGFAAAPTQRWRVCGEVERHRLLARSSGPALPSSGLLLAAEPRTPIASDGVRPLESD